MKFGRCLLVVTGASKGFGNEICTQFAKHVDAGSVMVGIARSEEGLNNTKEMVTSVNPHIKFLSVPIDLATDIDSTLDELINLEESNFDKVFIFHNAGSLGDLKYLDSISNFKRIQGYFDLNISSVVCLNKKFLDMVKKMYTKPKIYVINVSSLCAVMPIKSWGLYCSGKAARDMLFKVLALEREDINVLNYAPGPLDTDMQVEARAETSDPEVRDMFISMKSEGKLVLVSSSVEKLVRIISEAKYKSGDHVDFYDE